MGKSVVQEAFTRTSQSNRVLVRLVSCRAPSEVAEPEQVRADLLPPPRSTSLRAMGPNSDCLSILFFCFSKLVTTSFHLLMAVTALSRHTPSMVLADFLVPLLFFLFLFLFLFFLFFLFFLLFFLLFLFFLFFLLFLPFLFFLVLFFLFFLFFSPFFAFLFFLFFLFFLLFFLLFLFFLFFLLFF